MRLNRPTIAWAASLAVMFPGIANLTGASGPEEMLKSAAVLSFLRYTEWPPAADRSVTVGVMGRTSFVQVLRSDLEGRVVSGRPVRVMEFKPAMDPRCCQLLYFATDKSAEIRPVLAASRALRILTIGETDRFLDFGGTVNLFLSDGHIGFEADSAALDRSGITISGSMLRLGQMRKKAGRS